MRYAVDHVLGLWRTGMDTKAIADALHLKESMVERHLHRMLDEKWKIQHGKQATTDSADTLG